MSDPSAPPHQPADVDGRVATRIERSARQCGSLDEFWRWFGEASLRVHATATPIPLERLEGWVTDPETGDIGHHSGRFFTIEGIDVRTPDEPVRRWMQPIINQPETGVLGIVVKEFDGVLHCLMQAKPEPGNHNGVQLSPTVQATRSNYTRVHGGRDVPFLDCFRDPAKHTLVDVRQSEQGAWFQGKRNRNMVVEADEVTATENFHWLTFGQLYRLLTVPDLINMDTRTVLSCLPVAYSGAAGTVPTGDGFLAALARSRDPGSASRHDLRDVLHWISGIRTEMDVRVSRVPLVQVDGWRRRSGRIVHEHGRFFEVLGAEVHASGREVLSWHQPMIRPCGTGVVALLVTRFHGVLHALLQTRIEPGYLDVVELAPTVQCTPENYGLLPADAYPRFLDDVLRAEPDRVWFDTTLSEEGGRFYHARNRYLIVEVAPEHAPEPARFRWLTVHQITELLRHSYYLNVQARSLVTCLHGLPAQRPPAPDGPLTSAELPATRGTEAG